MSTENASGNTGTETQQKVEPKIVGMGKSQLVTRSENVVDKQEVGKGGVGATGVAGAEADANKNVGAAAGELSEPSEEQIKSFFEKQGMKWNGLDDAKAKFSDKPAGQQKAEPTAEEKKQQAADRDRRRLDKFIGSGGTIDQYAALKAVAEKDVNELSQYETRRELKEAGFPEDKIDSIIKEHYYQLTEEDLEMLDDETEKEFAKRKKEYFAGKLASVGSPLQDKAKQALSKLDADLDAEDSQAQKESELSSKVEEHFSKLPREMTFELGKIDDHDIDPIKYNVTDAEINEAFEVLKSPEKRKQFLYNEDGSLNIERISEALVAKTVLSNLVKTSALEGGTREVKKFEATFPKNAHALGVNGGSASTETGAKKTGMVTSFGKPEVVRRKS